MGDQERRTKEMSTDKLANACTRRNHQRRDTICPSPALGRLLPVLEAADRLGISPGTLRNWVSMRRIEHVKVGRLTRIAQVTIDRYIAEHTVQACQDVE